MRLSDAQLRQLQDQNGADVLTYLVRRIQPVEDAAAVLNEVLEITWRRAAHVPEDPELARMWMFGVASKLAANHRRSSSRRRALTARLAEQLLIGESEPTVEVLDVRAAILALPPKQREVVRLVHWDGFTLQEASLVLGISASIARGRYQAARSKLARLLSADDVERESQSAPVPDLNRS